MSVFDTQNSPLDFNQPKEFGEQTQFKELYAGAGSNVFKVNKDGVFVGATTFAAAPFKISFAGAVTMTLATITGYVATGGAAADVNAGVTTIDGGKITALSVTASQIAASTITGAKIAATTVAAGNIVAGTITATEIANSTITGGKIANTTITGANIAASTITSDKISVTTLSAITADLGTITAGSITGVTITGGTVQTATSGQRIVMSSNVLSSYDASALRLKMNGSKMEFYNTAGSITGYIIGSSSGNNPYIIFNAGSIGFSLYENLGAGALDLTNIELQFCGSTYPNGAGSKNLGDATNYWNDVSYKTLTDRGCLGSCDDGVELQDGRIVPDTEAIKAIQKRADGKKTVYGMPMLDYKTFPKMAYKPADKDGKVLPRDKDDNPYWIEKVEDKETKKMKEVKRIAADGVEMTSMFSVMLGAIRELTIRMEKLETKLT